MYLGAGGTLTGAKPAGMGGSDSIAYVPATSPCTRQTSQWSMGVFDSGLQDANAPANPCTQDDRTFQLGPGALTYTTAPMKTDTTLAGPVDASIYASSNRPDLE